ncbi:PBSX family phage terminase large subunit [Flavonifractor plautii]|jgi:PBSX family phage terminase large subunit|uniref:PBSX family phage terminase large subunit n=1 Tax=Flavonifractor plautii TaxID=292800 RepID=UPI0020545305|nr:MAG TPA: large terminase [Caudoviricetes sp.]DAO88990.1 MAG TPA: large terminase [Caudoviricetes sp.]
MLLSPKQTEFVREGHHRWNFKGGATRSGKTYLDFRWIIPIRIRERVGKDGLTVILGVTKSTIERNVLEPMRTIYGDALVGTISSDNTAWIFGEKCYCLGAEKVSQVSKIRGASIKYCYGDEVADWSQEVFELLKSRLDKAYSCFDGTYNPQGPNHWLKVFLDSKADIFSQTYTIDDNPFLPEAFVENLKREYRGTVFYDRYILGRWALAEGLIYPMFGESNIVDEEPPAGRYYISVDYGTLNPFSAGLWCVTKQGAVRIKEYYYSGRGTQKQLTDEEYYQAIRELADGYNVDYVVIDPSAASFITTVFRHNEFHVVKANNDVMDGIRRTSVYLKSGELKIHRQCKDAIREFGLYRWDEESTVDKVIKADDHAMDDIRYFANTILVRYFPVMR